MDFITQLYQDFHVNNLNNVNNLNSPLIFIFTGILMLYISGILSEIPIFITLISYITIYFINIIYKYCLSNSFNILREVSSNYRQLAQRVNIPEDIQEEITHIATENVMGNFMLNNINNRLDPYNRNIYNRYNVNHLSYFNNNIINNIEQDLFDRSSYVRNRNTRNNTQNTNRKSTIDINSLPICSIDSGDCPYCLDKMEANKCIIGLCGHKFHKNCLETHFKYCKNNKQPFKCPVCRNIWN